MRYLVIILLVLVSGLALAGCNSEESDSIADKGNGISQDWNSAFVVWNGLMYEWNEEEVLRTTVQIGTVTQFSGDESTTFNRDLTFSNFLIKGTKLYKMKDIDEKVAIAAKIAEDRYLKLLYAAPYGSKEPRAPLNDPQ